MLSQPKQKRVKIRDIVTVSYDKHTLYKVVGYTRTGLGIRLSPLNSPTIVGPHKRSSIEVVVVREFL